jgi:NAD(P)H-nitrite reductase large subunit
VRGWTPILNSEFETTKPGVFIAGDATGIGGVKLAVLQGRCVATEVARQLGAIKDKEAAENLGRLKKQIMSHRWYQIFLKKIYAFRPGLLDLLTGDTFLCRCEEVNFKSITDAIEKGFHNIERIKRLTRIGMGRCQGRFCYPSLVGILSQTINSKQLAREDFSARPPVKPLPVGGIFEIP